EPAAEPVAEPAADPDIDSLDIRAIPAETIVPDVQIERAGGAHVFFWAEEIPNEVFARMEGKSFGDDCTVARDELRYLRMLHRDAQGNALVGELVVNASVANEVLDIFWQLYQASYPIHRMHLVDDYDAIDEASCADDNTSAFNYRPISGGTGLSNHALGLAIDINTYENPYYIPATGHLFPPDATRYLDRSLDEPYMIHPGDLCYQLFTEHGWTWGGDWQSVLDYQHFEKPQG
ncbi:MAG: M15 family metallopeptidase, partial [Coriobacteriales bacterium]|nr:M15 family metallopeptidase [Coriobacteriales bacterium]